MYALVFIPWQLKDSAGAFQGSLASVWPEPDADTTWLYRDFLSSTSASFD